jgi:lipoyl-dependent peroxiredoxin
LTADLKGTSMAKILYTAYAHVTGGRDGNAKTADGALELNLRVPTEMGGSGGGTNPEELFAVGYAACFESALATVARRRHLDPDDIIIDSAVSLLPTGDGGFKLAVTLDVSLSSIGDRETAAQLIRDAHEVCPYSNATRGNIDVTLLIHGEPIRRQLTKIGAQARGAAQSPQPFEVIAATAGDNRSVKSNNHAGCQAPSRVWALNQPKGVSARLM